MDSKTPRRSRRSSHDVRRRNRLSLQLDKTNHDINALSLSMSAQAPTVSMSYRELMDSLQPETPTTRPNIDVLRSRHRSLKPCVEIIAERIDNAPSSPGSRIKIIKPQEQDAIVAEISRQSDDRRYRQSLTHATCLLKELEKVHGDTGKDQRRRSCCILDISNRCIGLKAIQQPEGTPVRQLPGEVELTWRQGVTAKIAPNGNMSLVYMKLNEKGKPERSVRHYYLTHNGIINAAIDLDLCLSGRNPSNHD